MIIVNTSYDSFHSFVNKQVLVEFYFELRGKTGLVGKSANNLLRKAVDCTYVEMRKIIKITNQGCPAIFRNRFFIQPRSFTTDFEHLFFSRFLLVGQ